MIVGAHPRAEHCIPSPERLLPKTVLPHVNITVFEHPLITAPNVIDENVDVTRFRGHPLERGRYLRNHPAGRNEDPVNLASLADSVGALDWPVTNTRAPC